MSGSCRLWTRTKYEVYRNNTIVSSFGQNFRFLNSTFFSRLGIVVKWLSTTIITSQKGENGFFARSIKRKTTFDLPHSIQNGGKMSMECGQKRFKLRHVGSSNTHIGDVFGIYKMSAANLPSLYKMGKGVWQRIVLRQRSSDSFASI
jgi:hypothetical protein